MRKILFIIFCLVAPQQMFPQKYVAGYINEYNLQGRVKQVEEFMARFNNEEDWRGRKTTKNYGRQYRMKYLRTLFDHQRFPLRKGRLGPLSEQFIQDVANHGYKIHFTDSTWRAEVSCSASVNGRAGTITLYLHTHKAGPYEYVWTVTDVSGALFANSLSTQSTSFISDNRASSVPIISPTDHETGFMSIPIIFNGQKKNVSKLFSQPVPSGRLAQFASMVQNGQIRINTVSNVAFRFDNVPGWQFSIRRINKRNSVNTGWLITSIKQTKT